MARGSVPPQQREIAAQSEAEAGRTVSGSQQSNLPALPAQAGRWRWRWSKRRTSDRFDRHSAPPKHTLPIKPVTDPDGSQLWLRSSCSIAGFRLVGRGRIFCGERCLRMGRAGETRCC